MCIEGSKGGQVRTKSAAPPTLPRPAATIRTVRTGCTRPPPLQWLKTTLLPNDPGAFILSSAPYNCSRTTNTDRVIAFITQGYTKCSTCFLLHLGPDSIFDLPLVHLHQR